jgi:hypothetical protein
MQINFGDQHRVHPSIVVWSYIFEITMRGLSVICVLEV